ncbi:MAG: Short-chain dehydrogenase/reductase [Chloroflexi bacterium]|nr:Short-chain dehydrogenase/reductase [Chloroflexota bacterium]
MAGRMAGKVVVVTGAARGIGRGCAEMLAREGARVVIGDVRADEGAAAAEAITAGGGEALFVQTDVVQEDQCAALVQAAATTFGKLDGLVNNVGWFPRAMLEDTTTEFWDQVLNVNLRGAFYCCKHAVPLMRANKGGSIVNIGSLNGIQGLPNLIAYASAKGGLLAMTKTLAGAYAGNRIRANYIIPGWVLTDTEIALHAGRGLSEEDLLRAGAALPLGRHQTPEDTAYAVIYLLSDESAQVTGTVMHIDAGASTLPIPPSSPYVG